MYNSLTGEQLSIKLTKIHVTYFKWVKILLIGQCDLSDCLFSGTATSARQKDIDKSFCLVQKLARFSLN